MHPSCPTCKFQSYLIYIIDISINSPILISFVFLTNVASHVISLSLQYSSLSFSSSSPSLSPSAGAPDLQPRWQWALDYNIVVIIAVVMCAVVCALGLNSMLLCILQCFHRALTEPVGWVAARRSNSRLRKKDVASLPTSVYPGLTSSSSSSSSTLSCAICLVDFSDGDSVRLLPNCNHGFHVACIDQWLLSHSSCPTCRLLLNPHMNSRITLNFSSS